MSMKMGIYQRMKKASWKRDWFSTVSFVAFVAMSVAMVALTAMLFANLTGAIGHLMETAGTPDFLQMHAGEVNAEELEKFARERPEVEDYQLLCFLNLENSILMLGEESLLDSTQDNGICVQGNGFDYMLGLENELPEVRRGEVYVPVCYESMYQVEIGDRMQIGDKALTVAGFIRDSQMNSMMASSKRFLVCEGDYEELKGMGSEEYLIEFLLAGDADTNAFQTAYEAAKLPMNGPTITRPLVKMMNTLSDGIMIMLILLISVLVLLIALVCIRFMLLTRVVSEAEEVGMLKAIGVSGKRIRSMFLGRYYPLIAAGAVLGMAAAVCLFKPLSAQMQKLYGVSANSWSRYLYAILSAALIGGIIVLFVLRILRHLNEMTAIAALTGRRKERRRKDSMLCILLVTAIAVFLMVIPSNLYSTLSAPGFVTYMGIGNAEIRMDMRSGEAAGKAFETIGETLAADESIREYALYQTSLLPVWLEDGTEMKMLMEQGDHGRFPVNYSQGEAPSCGGEVALSYLLAEELGLKPGDEIVIGRAEGCENCRITGIYSDITNGGKTAKLYSEPLSGEEDVMWRIAYVTLADGAKEAELAEKYQAMGVEVTDMSAQIQGTYGPTLEQIRQVDILVKAVAACIILFVVVMFVRMMVANRRNRISIKKAIGFRNSEIEKEFWKSCIPYMAAGILLGAAGACTFGEGICGAALKSLGAEGFRFTLSIWRVALDMLVGGLAVTVAVYLGSRGMKCIKALECCRGGE